VKGDLKLLVYERKRNSQRKVPDESTSKIIRDYLAGYGLLSTNEVYLFIEFDHGDAIVYSFKPIKDGLHSDYEIAFDPIS
jgi:hypothetical protein